MFSLYEAISNSCFHTSLNIIDTNLYTWYFEFSLWSRALKAEIYHSVTWVFSGCSGFLPQKWPPSAKHPCIIQDPIGNKLSSFHGFILGKYTYLPNTCLFFCFFFVLWYNLRLIRQDYNENSKQFINKYWTHWLQINGIEL
jgi:hypothetical protein